MLISVNNVNYHVEVIGEGEPLLLLHGFTGAGSNWKECITHIERNFKFILIDLIGHGRTESPENVSRYQIQQVHSDIIEIMDYLEVRKAHLLGYSMGGRVALSLAISYPERFLNLILESSSPGIEDKKARDERKAADEKLAEFIEKKGIADFVTYWEDIPLFLTQKLLPQSVQLSIHNQRLTNNPVGLANSLKGMGTGVQPSYWNNLCKLDINTLLLCGEKDSKFCEIADQMSKFIKNSELKKISGVGHAIHVEQPRIFGKIINEFLS